MRRALIALLALGLCAAGCWSDEDNGSAPGNTGAEREIRGFQLTETHDGRRSWELHAVTAWRLPGRTETSLDQVAVDFFDDAGGKTSHLTADKGTVDENTGDMTATGRVTLVSTSGDTLYTPELHYGKGEDRVAGDGFVRIAKPDRVLTGTGFTAKPDLSSYEVQHDVHITLLDREGRVENGP